MTRILRYFRRHRRSDWLTWVIETTDFTHAG